MPSAVALTTNGDVSMSQVLSETQTDREEDGQERKPKDQKSDQHIGSLTQARLKLNPDATSNHNTHICLVFSMM